VSGAVVLIGLSGSGKSTVGKLLAARIGLPFLDTDRIIEERTSTTIADLFASQGEQRFRDVEAAVVAIACGQAAVVATGGGAVLREANRRAMRKGNLVVWLDPPLDILARRLVAHQHGEVRPLLEGDIELRLAELNEQRRHLYAGTAHARVGRLPHASIGSHQVAGVIKVLYHNWQTDEIVR
jgi:shikimate kinase